LNRSSVRELKAEVADSVLPKILERLRARRSARATNAAHLPTADISSDLFRQSGVALGIVPSRRKGGDLLAVRVQDVGIGKSPGAFGELANKLGSLTKGEIQIRYVGAVTKCSGSHPPPSVRPWQQCEARPILPGCSIGHFNTTAGSVGGFFYREGGGAPSSS